jgi:hypothetical protein
LTVLRSEIAQVGEEGIARFLASEPVQHGVGQNALEQQGKLRQGLVSVVGAQLDHAVLQDVQGRIFVPNMEKGALERLFFHVFQKI